MGVSTAYSGAEEQPVIKSDADYFGVGLSAPTATSTSGDVAHSGSFSLKVASGQGFVFTPPATSTSQSYHISFWSTNSNATVGVSNCTLVTAAKKIGTANGWHLIEADVSVSSTNVNPSIWCDAGSQQTYFDDFRVHPASSSMTSYVYNQWGELSHILNANNLYTRYEYDGMGRLVKTYQETLTNPEVMTSQVKYNFAKP